jgi:multicomponent Na+:H+ antiporter subunit D
MARLWEAAFWKEPPTAAPAAPVNGAMVVPIAILVCLILGLTVAAGPVFDLSVRAAEQLLDPVGYVNAVLRGGN